MSSNFPHGIEPMAGTIPVTFGRTIWCDKDNGYDGNDGLSKANPVQTIAQAYSIMITNKFSKNFKEKLGPRNEFLAMIRDCK